MRRLFRWIFQLLALVLIVFVLTAAWLICDGLNDMGDHADVALVCAPGDQQDNKALMETRLDRVVQLYNDEKFPAIVVSGAGSRSDEAGTMGRYLKAHGVPAEAVIEDRRGDSTQDTARNLAEIMKLRHLHSVMIVTDYYHITRTKLALRHEGIAEIQNAHVGKLQKTDALPIAREIVAFYDYTFRYYLLPEAEKAKGRGQGRGRQRVKVEAEKAKEKVDQKPRLDWRSNFPGL